MYIVCMKHIISIRPTVMEYLRSDKVKRIIYIHNVVPDTCNAATVHKINTYIIYCHNSTNTIYISNTFINNIVKKKKFFI